MRLTCFRPFSMNCMKLAKYCIARVSLAFFCLVSLPASGSDDTTAINHISGTLDILNEYIQTDQYDFFSDWKEDELAALAEVVPAQYQDRVLKSLVGGGLNDSFQWSSTDNIRAYLQALTRATTGYNTNPGVSILDYLQWIQYYLSSHTNSGSSTFVTNIINVNGGKDVLAGNPWWATNSQFAVWHYGYDGVFPDDGKSLDGRYSFPQFLSLWSARLQTRSAVPSSSDLNDWASLYGHDYFIRNYASSSNAEKIRRGYTWFDWMSDAMRSNWVAQTTEQRTLDSLLTAIQNSGSGGSTSIVNVVVTNVVGGVTNILNADDILAGNPWWHTNSGFRISYDRFLTEPYPSSPDGALSFPELMSALSGSHVRFQTPPVLDSFDYLFDGKGSWGYNRWNTTHGHVYTFEDWIADFLRSNLVLTTSLHATNIEEELYQAGYDTTDDDSITNAVLPDYSLPSDESIPNASESLASGESAINSLIDALPKPSTGGDPEIVVIPEFTVGGIHVREYRASLNSSIVPVCRSVLSFLYAVGVACFVFTTCKAEYLFYASLGRMWGSHGYDPSAV